MASETFFADGDKVMYSLAQVKYLAKHNGLTAVQTVELRQLTGVVTACDDSGRECCYYDVKWNATEEKLETLGIDDNGLEATTSSEQSDHIIHYRNRE